MKQDLMNEPLHSPYCAAAHLVSQNNFKLNV